MFDVVTDSGPNDDSLDGPEQSPDSGWRLASDGTILWVSSSVRHTLGWEPWEISGRTLGHFAHPSDKESVARLEQGARDGRTTNDRVRFQCPSGTWHWTSIELRPFVSLEGTVVGTSMTMADVHGEVVAGERSSRRPAGKSADGVSCIGEAELRLAIGGAPQAMAIVGLHRALLEVNDELCRALGRDHDWLLSHTVTDVLHPDDRESDMCGCDALLAGSTDNHTAKRRMITADGSILWVLLSTALMRDEQGMPLFYVSQFNDFTAKASQRCWPQ